MLSRGQSPWLFLIIAVLGCTPTPPPPGVLRPDPKNFPKSLSGPMPNFGPFVSRLDALSSACSLIFSQQDASAGREDDMHFDLRWRNTKEYCAWLYYTPDDKYELSMLVESTGPVPPRKQHERRCRAPAFVDDARYPPRSLRYLYFVHNHPATPTNLSEEDIGAVIKIARLHGPFVDTKEGRIPVGVIAFFANSYRSSAAMCDGFYEYSWGNSWVMRWTRDDEGRWQQEKAGTVTWLNEQEFNFEPE